jgi:Fe-S cluster assembly protein SufD
MSNIITSDTQIDFQRLADTEWMNSLRKSAWESYNDCPMPDRVQHLWRYTKPENFVPTDPATAKELTPMTNPASRRDVDDSLREQGVVLSDLRTAISQHEDLTEPYIGRLVGIDSGKFESANLALFGSGFFVYVPDNVTIAKPILLDQAAFGNEFITRLLIVLGRNSELTLIDRYTSDDGCRLVNGAVEIFAGKSSRLRYVALQNLAPTTSAFISQRTEASRDANVYTVFGSFGGSIAKIDAGTILNGPGAESRMYGIVFGDGSQHFDHHTVHHHVSSDTYSNIDVRIALKGRAQSAYTGLIRIDETAANCEAYQENRNLLLDKGTKAETIPELEILNDEVSCSHGATIGPIDPDMVFYLRSRGYSESDAVRAIVGGFMEPTINLLPADIRDTLRDSVEKKLEG